MYNYTYYNLIKFEIAQKNAQERIKGGDKKLEDELVLEEYLKLCGRVEDEQGNVILTPCDLQVQKEKIKQAERAKVKKR